MNYLGHAYLSFDDPAILTGNMIADHVKGKAALEYLPAGIKEGILLHRAIDSFTDHHPALKEAQHFFRKDYGLYSAAIIDILMDYFLANDPQHFLSEHALLAFSVRTYQLLHTQSAHFPEPFSYYFPYMEQYNWLYNYRTHQGINKSLNGLTKRAKHFPPADKAYQIFSDNEIELSHAYRAFIEDIISFVKVDRKTL